jgi:hypothetical protein
MKDDWKIRQELYHRINTEYSDNLNNLEIELTENVVEHAVDYFYTKEKGWIYPSKSYMVGICYAKWLSEEFGGNAIDYLNDPDLLYGNDPYFITYNEDEITYSDILNGIGGWQFCQKSGMVPDVRQYFIEEFMLNVE